MAIVEILSELTDDSWHNWKIVVPSARIPCDECSVRRPNLTRVLIAGENCVAAHSFRARLPVK